jgi:hypothetical protein
MFPQIVHHSNATGGLRRKVNGVGWGGAKGRFRIRIGIEYITKCPISTSRGEMYNWNARCLAVYRGSSPCLAVAEVFDRFFVLSSEADLSATHAAMIPLGNVVKFCSCAHVRQTADHPDFKFSFATQLPTFLCHTGRSGRKDVSGPLR